MTLANLQSYDLSALGENLRQARRRSGLTQEQAADLIDAARTTMVAIEKGERSIRKNELETLADAYGIAIEELFGTKKTPPTFTVQFRSLIDADTHGSISDAIETFRQLCFDYLALERLLDAPLPRRYPHEYPVEGRPTGQTAEWVADQERQRLGLGDGPISSLRGVFENEIGIRVFYFPIHPSSYSEIYHYDDVLGACMAINILHPPPRRRWSLAHAYAHFLAHRYQSSVSDLQVNERKPPSETFADDFATYFLMPSSSVMRRALDIKASSKRFTVGHIFLLAQYFGVSSHAMCLRLEELKLVGAGTWDKLKLKGLKVKDIENELGITAKTEPEDLLPAYFLHLALTALDRELITEGKFARLLRLGRVKAKSKAQEMRDERGGDAITDVYHEDLFT